MDTLILCVAMFATGTLWLLAPEVEQFRCRWAVRLYALLSMYVLWACLVTSMVDYPAGEWVIVSLDVIDGPYLGAVFLFYFERLSCVEQASGTVHQGTSRMRAVRMLLRVLAVAVIAASVAIGVAGGILNPHHVIDGHWFIAIRG